MNAKSPTCSLIIATYNWAKALNLVLKSVINQTVMPSEIIIADDGSTSETESLIQSFKAKINVPLVHVWHEDKGFRLAEIRNKAIKKAKGEYIVQIDGDVILHKRFIEDHLAFAEKDFYIRGSRVRLGQQISKELLQAQRINISIFNKDVKSKLNGFRFPFLTKQLMFKKESELKMLGCNMAFWKEDFVEVNGYSNDLIGWGFEDSELVARFINIGLKKKVIKHSAICYHIYHKENSRENEQIHTKKLQEIVDLKTKRADTGYNEV